MVGLININSNDSTQLVDVEVYTWRGEQCTTTVKTAIQEAFPFHITNPLGNFIPDITQMPKGLLEDLKSFKSTSKEHSQQLSVQTIIKPESKNFP